MNESLVAEVVEAQKQGESRGIVSICSANPQVLAAAFEHAMAHDLPLLIESTCNQVNQDGGYTGMRPADFMSSLRHRAETYRFPQNRLVVGGDHLGPSPWQSEAAEPAMDKARRLVADYVSAGYDKIHLDASMKCADDEVDRPLPKELAAKRSAQLAQVAEATHKKRGTPSSGPIYVIGTEVPRPGGALEQEEQLVVTLAEDVLETIGITREAFLQQGLALAWERVIAVVVQPGVEFGNDSLEVYDRTRAESLVRFIEQQPQLVYEAHSTDYQSAATLRQLVEDHFAILKVGPALTFALREAIFALAQIEAELFGGRPGVTLSQLPLVLEAAMRANPAHWQRHYQGSAVELRLARRFSYSDRLRYYWAVPEVQAALQQLWTNLASLPIPMTLLSQFLPIQYGKVRDGRLPNTARVLVQDKISQVLDDYAYACGHRSDKW